jgi:DNA-directed RNA polymerase subunit RPC12/RpoP
MTSVLAPDLPYRFSNRCRHCGALLKKVEGASYCSRCAYRLLLELGT